MTLFIVSYLAGVLTILSPCILPVLPFIFARADRPFGRSTLPMLFGMVLTFAGVASLAAVGGSWAVHVNEVGRFGALLLLGAFGLTLVSTRIATFLSRPIVALGNRISSKAHAEGHSVGSSLLLGAATGLLWAPCAGPILGLVLTGAALNGANFQTALLLASYAAGTATSLALAVLAGGKIFATMKKSLGFGEKVRKGLGVAVLAGVAAIGLGLDTGLLARLSYTGTTNIEQTLLDAAADGVSTTAAEAWDDSDSNSNRRRLPVEGTFPSLDGAVTWLNSAPLTTEQLRGKVVLIDFWTYSCINCIRTIPYVKAWAEKYKDQGLVVIGVHSPEFAFEKKISNVERAIGNFGISYPVAVDNDFKIWRAFGNNYWPAHYFIDSKGLIRYHHFGEGNYARSEQVIQELLAEAAGSKSNDVGRVSQHPDGARAAPDLTSLRSDEAHLDTQPAVGSTDW
jgi:cytochrome c biogenesis protein CcdA/thiol-disulfide isomerase/thioredoxin